MAERTKNLQDTLSETLDKKGELISSIKNKLSEEWIKFKSAASGKEGKIRCLVDIVTKQRHLLQTCDNSNHEGEKLIKELHEEKLQLSKTYYY